MSEHAHLAPLNSPARPHSRPNRANGRSCRVQEKNRKNKIVKFSYYFLRHWKKGSSTAQLGRFRKVFNDEQEGDLRTYLYDMDSVFYGLTREDFKTLVFEYAKRNNVTYPPSWDKNKKAGDDWLAGFMRRNPQITLRTPDATSIGRVKDFNRPQV
ncbi:unnamed protein product [Euphydryas editha]|uniref:HTH CENPB-type domain-containing protein n=1 Tax=Euphydryas editha TaxID=104508 RepID=A0AAU9V8U7_EUPED|nr:unnamed protein product [Euphydryas editha]